VHEAAPLSPGYPDALEPVGLSPYRRFLAARWHRRWEGLPATFTAWTVVAVVTASLLEIVPMFLVRGNVPTIQSVRPYTPLELYGRDIYVSEGCYNCHSQMVRPIRAETLRYGEYSKPGEFVYDRPFQWGSRRIGPDLHRVGGKYPHLWHVRHMEDPRSTSPGSIMPAYPWLARERVDWTALQRGVAAQAVLGVPYAADEIRRAPELAREQARAVAGEIVTQGGPAGLDETRLVALVAYLQRLGTDIKKAPVAAARPDGRQASAAPDGRP
jgi:cytochrome c oxidase cbb3-type subunit I/II